MATALVFFATRSSDNGAAVTPAASSSAAAAAPFASPSAGPTVLKGLVISSAARLATPIPPYFSSSWADAHPPADAPGITAQGAIVVDLASQQIMYAKNIDERRPPASIMKIMTAMVTLDQVKPSQELSVSRDAANMEPNRMGLSVGEELTVQDLLYGMLLDSGNDAARALADGLPGGLDGFIHRMNDKAASFGLTNTHFVDVAGLDDDNYTTPYDMAVLADAALSGYPTIRTVVSTKQASIPGTATHKPFAPINLNDLLWDYPGTYGMKVGYTDAAEYTIILAAQKDNHNVLIVLLGSKHHFTEGKQLFDWAFGHIPAPDGAPIRKFATNLEKA